MSFILDALRKSESERQRRVGPGLAQVPAAVARDKATVWLPVLIGLLAVNAVVMASVFLWPDPVAHRPDAEPVNPTVKANPSPPAETDAYTEIPPPSVSKSSAPLMSQQRDVRPLSAELSEPVALKTATVETIPRATEITPSSLVTPSPAEIDTTNYPTLTDLRLSGMLSLPDIHVDVHVFSANPAERFVFINMRKYREGEATNEGPVVRTIRPDGVVFNYRGTLFFLPHE